ncbi:helix-turn-helix domain-containing protein [Halostella sp. JP-L12]|uniref:LAGLIDADG family homing endonuclease n=1 Tax=Halostella TaxID=1843185 RepID=UPI000EF7A799|nr:MULTISPECIES: LAGLIDADG family homing endonuclease [Halostella]NHN46404.1 helix-turn-helix domain-containing protein [Halostella sp. JP-L12]
MAQAENAELVDSFEQFYRSYYRDEIGKLAQQYPNERRSLYVDWQDLYRYDPDLADDYLSKPEQLREYAEEALRLYDLPVDVSLGQAHVRIRNLPETTEIREIRARHVNKLVSVRGIVRKATDVRPKIEEAAFECQRCGTLTRVPQSSGDFQEPHECQGCERQGPFQINFDQSEFVDAQKIRVQESPEGLRGGETPQAIDVHVEDDITGEVTPGDHVAATGVLNLEQQGNQQEKSPIFDVYMDGVSVEIEEEQFEDMEITEDDKQSIVELSGQPDIYEKMVGSIAPSIYGYDQEKLAMILQLFSGVTKHLPDGSRIRGDLHMLLIGDPGTGKCLDGDTRVTLSDGRDVPIRELVEENLDDPKPIDDGVWDEADFEVPSLTDDGGVESRRATKVWKREAPETMYRIRTSSGHELEVTPSHPLFVQSDGRFAPVRAENLSEGEFVASPRTCPVAGDDTLDVDFRPSESYNAVQLDLPNEWTPKLARLIGYIVAEGYVEQRDDNTGYVSITNNDPEVLDDVADALADLGLNYSEREPYEGKDAREIICSSGEFVSFLANLEPALLDGSKDQRVPAAIQTAEKETRCSFLQAFIEGEGHVSRSQREVSVASMSERLLEDVRSLLITLGIDSQLQERHNGSYRLRVSGRDLSRYVETIGFVTPRKSEAAAEFADVDGNTNTDVVPIGDTLRRVREDLGLAQTDCGIPRSTYQHYERGRRNPSRESLKQIVEAFESAVAEQPRIDEVAPDGGVTLAETIASLRNLAHGDVGWDRIVSIEAVGPDDDWVYDLEVAGTHSYVSNGVISHNSQMLSYIQNIAPRSVYTSGKGSSSAGLTAAAVRDDFGDGQQWTLEAGALVLADQGIAAVDELDKMAADDRSAMHEALEQQKISVSKAGINATLKSRCSLLGAANPKYGRFDQYESIGEQIDLEPALISRFDLIFTVTDQPDEEEDKNLAEHILTTNYAGELNTQRNEMASPDVSREEVEDVTEEVDPVIDAELLRKYVAYAKQNCHPRMTDEAREAIRDFYVDLRAKGQDEDAPVPVTARKLEALVRLAEASARVRLSDTVSLEDAERVIEIVRSCLQDIGVDPETGQFDADVVETGTSKSQRDRIKNLKQLIGDIEEEYDEGAPVDVVMERADEIGMDHSKAEHEIEKLKQKGEVYEPRTDHLRTT